MVAAGELIGRYRVERELGGGGMGLVLLAHHIDVAQRKVAIKVLREELAAHPEANDRFLIEAEAAARLVSDHVGRILDIGRLGSGLPYMVMELLEGADLGDVLAQRRALPVPEAIEYVLQAACGLAEAHACGIVHRDIKPANLFRTIAPDGSPLIKVLDFGIAKVRTIAGSRGMTQTGTKMGSIPYMSPEQLRSTKDVDERADLWSLGVTLYELLAGTLPFSVGSVDLHEAAIRIWTEPPAPLPPAIPRALRDVVERCLAKPPADRYPNLAELAAALAPFTGNGPALAQRVRRVLATRDQLGRVHAPTVLRSGPAAAHVVALGAPAPRPADRTRLLAIAILAGAAMVAIAIILAFQ